MVAITLYFLFLNFFLFLHQLLVHGEVQIGKDSIMNWNGKAFTIEDGTVVCVTFST